jgi:hypothetical protein
MQPEMTDSAASTAWRIIVQNFARIVCLVLALKFPSMERPTLNPKV